MIYEPTTGYASRVAPERLFKSAEDAAHFDKTETAEGLARGTKEDFRGALTGLPASEALAKTILLAADMIRERIVSPGPQEQNYAKQNDLRPGDDIRCAHVWVEAPNGREIVCSMCGDRRPKYRGAGL